MGKAVDAQGYRPNVGMVICNDRHELFWAKRRGMNAWQFPQGGIRPGESLLEAMYRELEEEVGLHADDVNVIGQTEEWVKYEFGGSKTTRSGETYVGQKQIWFLLHLISSDDRIDINHPEHQEFDEWTWVDYEHPKNAIVDFKKPVYDHILTYFKPLIETVG